MNLSTGLIRIVLAAGLLVCVIFGIYFIFEEYLALRRSFLYPMEIILYVILANLIFISLGAVFYFLTRWVVRGLKDI
jgi:hypothetical protein